MELLFALLAIQAAGTLAGGVWLWRRQQRQNAEFADLRAALRQVEQVRVAAGARRAASGEVVPLKVISEAPREPVRTWASAEASAGAAPAIGISGETARGLTLGILAIAPALGFAFNVSASVIVACGLVIGAAMMAISHRPAWQAAAWAGAATAGAWASMGFVLGSAQAEPVSYALCLSLAGIIGLVHAYNHRVTPGVIMALIMTIAALSLGAQIGMVSAAGIAFGVIVAASAITGSMSLRLEGMHLAAFGASLIGLFVLSGQDGAAIWFTPAATWAGAIFFAIAAVVVPQLGARGVAIAGTGALAPLAAIAALYFSHHIADQYAIAAAFGLVAALLAGIIAAAMLRRERGLDALKATLWVLAFGAFIGFASAVMLALPAALAAPAFALAALGLAAVDLGLPTRAWRAFACICALFTLAFGFVAAGALLSEASAWPAFGLIGAGVAAPALILGGTALAARHRDANLSAGTLEAIVIVLATLAANLIVRVIYSGGATLLQPISFAEVGAQASVWLAAGLIIRERAQFGASIVRIGAANALLVMALGAMFAATALWVTPYWVARQSTTPFISHEALGFALPALLFLTQMLFWRGRGATAQTRVTLGAGALLLAAFVTSEVTNLDGSADWAGAVVGALSFAAAIGVNFIPGVVPARQTSR